MKNGLDMDAIATHEEDLDIDSLNDSQLYEKLKENNINAGPIVDSTREIYKKKLKKVLYGDDEESFASGGEADDNQDEDEIVAEDEEREAVDNGDLTDPIMEEDEDPVVENEEEVVDGVAESQCESKSDTDDDQPSGVSRPVDAPPGLRKRAPGSNAPRNDPESNLDSAENGTGPQPDAQSKTSLFVVVILVVVVVAAVVLYFLIRSVIADMLDKAAMDVEEVFSEAPNAAGGMEGEEVINEADSKVTSAMDGEEAANKAASGVEGD